MGLLHPFISCKLDSSLRSNFKNIDSISSPQRPQSSLFHHVLKTAQHIPFKSRGTMNLADQTRKSSLCVKQWKLASGWLKVHLKAQILGEQNTFRHKQPLINEDHITTVPDRPAETLWGGLTGSSSPRDRSSHGSSHQLPPHIARLLLLLWEFIWDCQLLTDIQHLLKPRWTVWG